MKKVFKKVVSALHPFILKCKRIKSTIDWNLSDVYLVSFPKSGNTWMDFILANILKQIRNEHIRIDYFTVQEYIPDLHWNPEKLSSLQHPRLIKSHETFQDWIERINIKGRNLIYPRVVYLVRDGRDVMVSYYHFQKNAYGYKGDFNSFINSRKNEWGDHIRGWLINNEFFDKRKMTVITFDDLKNKPFEVTKKLVDFIGLEVSDALINNALKLSDFSQVRELEERFGIPDIYINKDYRFARKGKSGDKEGMDTALLKEFYESNKDVFDFLGIYKNNIYQIKSTT